MRIIVLHERIGAQPRPDDADTLVQADAVARAAGSLGHDVRILPMDLDLAAARRDLLGAGADLVFNLVEGLDGTGRLVHVAAGLLDHLGIPYTGSPTDALYLTSNKVVAKRWMRAHGLPVPDWCEGDDSLSGRALIGRRAIVKSVWEHASLGLDDGSVVILGDDVHLREIVDARRARLGGRAFVESYVEGREFNVAAIQQGGGWRVLPVAEMRFDGLAVERPRIVGFDAKWEVASDAYATTRRCFDLPDRDRALIAELTRLTSECVRIFGLRGHARVDFRISDTGQPLILEVNANPCIAPDAGFVAAAHQGGLSYAQVVAALIDGATHDWPATQGGRRVGSTAPRLVHPGDSTAERDSPKLRIVEGLSPTERSSIWEIVGDAEWFTDAEARVAMELVDDHLARGSASDYQFLAARKGEELLGFSCFGHIPGTRTRFDLYWIGVHALHRRQKIGRALLAATEKCVAHRGGTLVQIETSSRASYLPTRRFYETSGYSELAVLNDFYRPGEDKVFFAKRLDRRAGRAPCAATMPL